MKGLKAGRSDFFRKSGSTLVMTLVMVGVLAISVAAMLSSVRYLVSSADDKIAEEECYHTAIAGLNVVKAWLMRPDVAKTQTGTAVGDALDRVANGALDCSSYILLNKLSPEVVSSMTTGQVAEFYTINGLTPGRSTNEDNPRTVLFEWGGGSNKPLIIRRGDANEGTPSTTLFNDTLGNDARSWIERIKITTPYCEGPLQDDLRKTSLIIEVEAHTAGAGVEKVRILSGRLLVIPQLDGIPPAQSGAAILSGATLNIAGTPTNIHWGPVMSKRNLEVLGLSYEKANRRLVFNTSTSNKYTGVGNVDATYGPEKWLRFLAGYPDGYLVDTHGNRLFQDGAGTNSAPVTDFVVQLFRNEFTDWRPVADFNPYNSTSGTGGGVEFRGLTPDNLETTDAIGMYFDPPNTENGEDWNSPEMLGRGAFVQQVPDVNKQIDDSFSSLDYATWKNFAIKNKGYIQPSGKGYVNATGQKLYVTSLRTLTTDPNPGPDGKARNAEFTELKQISMHVLVPANGANAGNTAGIPDRPLFVDTYADGTKADVKINQQDDFFWKGLLFINGDLTINGIGTVPNIWVKNPDQYYASPPDPEDRGQGYSLQKCILDGILRVTGNVTAKGNPKVYGSIVAGMPNSVSGFGAGGTPEIFYNTRCKDGLFRDPQDPIDKGLVSGPILELTQYR